MSVLTNESEADASVIKTLIREINQLRRRFMSIIVKDAEGNLYRAHKENLDAVTTEELANEVVYLQNRVEDAKKFLGIDEPAINAPDAPVDEPVNPPADVPPSQPEQPVQADQPVQTIQDVSAQPPVEQVSEPDVSTQPIQ